MFRKMEVSFGDPLEGEIIGTGAYADVKLPNPNSNMVYKIMPYRDAQIDRHAIQEIAYYQMVKHPTIIGLHRVIVSDDALGLVFPYYDCDLEDKINEGSLTEEIIRNIMFQMLHALRFIHKNGMIHRDISAKNIFLDKTNSAVLADFGLAALKDYLRSGRYCLGYALPYRPPEVMMHQQVTGRSDIWALGVVFSEMLLWETVRLPHNVDDHEETPTSLRVSWMFNQYGAPSLREIKGYDPVYRDMIYPKEGTLFRKLRDRKVDPVAIDLIRKMLVYSPKSRITAEKALLHPYFQSVPLKVSESLASFKFSDKPILVKRSHERSLQVDWLFSYHLKAYIDPQNITSVDDPAEDQPRSQPTSHPRSRRGSDGRKYQGVPPWSPYPDSPTRSEGGRSIKMMTLQPADGLIRVETVFLAINIMDTYVTYSGDPYEVALAAACLVIASAIVDGPYLTIEDVIHGDCLFESSFIEYRYINLPEVSNKFVQVLAKLSFDIVSETPNNHFNKAYDSWENFDECFRVHHILKILAIVAPLENTSNPAFERLEYAMELASDPAALKKVLAEVQVDQLDSLSYFKDLLEYGSHGQWQEIKLGKIKAEVSENTRSDLFGALGSPLGSPMEPPLTKDGHKPRQHSRPLGSPLGTKVMPARQIVESPSKSRVQSPGKSLTESPRKSPTPQQSPRKSSEQSPVEPPSKTPANRSPEKFPVNRSPTSVEIESSIDRADIKSSEDSVSMDQASESKPTEVNDNTVTKELVDNSKKKRTTTTRRRGVPKIR